MTNETITYNSLSSNPNKSALDMAKLIVELAKKTLTSI